MKKLMSRLTTFVFLGTVLVLASCSKSNDSKPKPSVSASQSTLSIVQDTTASFNVTISAAGGFKTITATVDNATLGTVAVSNIVGTGNATGTVTVTYTSLNILGNATITVTVTDDIGQTGTAIVMVDVTEHPPIEIANASGYHITGATTWGPDLTYHISSDVFIDAGASLTVQPGTTVIVEPGYTFTVRGNFYSYGTAQDSVVFTVPAQLRTKDNIFAGLWGGILSSNDPTYGGATDEMVVQYTRIEFVGLPGKAGTDIVDINEVAEGDPTYALFFNNINGTFVLQHSTLAYSVDVAVQVDQGKILITDNLFLYNGVSGGESIDIKGGTVGDIAYNVFYSIATNAVKANDKPAATPQTNIHMYNNTAIQCGWRQTAQATHGGSFYFETGGRGSVFNNIIASCRHGVDFFKSKTPDLANLYDGYNLMYGNDSLSVKDFYPSNGYISPGSANYSYQTAEDVVGAEGTNDPLFVGFTVSTFNDAAAAAASAGTDVTLISDAPFPYDLHLQADSPALGKGIASGDVNLVPYWTSPLSAGGKTYSSPAPSSYIGAFGTK